MKDSAVGFLFDYSIASPSAGQESRITSFYAGKLFMRYCGKYSKTVVSCGKTGDVNLYNVAQAITAEATSIHKSKCLVSMTLRDLV